MSDFLNNLNKVGMILQAGGGSLAGRDGMSVIRDYQAEQERARKEAAISALMGQSGIGGPQRALLDTMPLDMKQEVLYSQMFPQPVEGKVVGDMLINPYDGSVMGNYGPEPLGGDFLGALFQSESGGNFGADNGLGYVGRVQAGQARLDDFTNANGMPRLSTSDFRANPALQQQFEGWHFNDLAAHADRYADKYGTMINGIPFTREAAMGIAHLGGKGGLDRYVQTGGRYNPADAFGTSLSDYHAKFAGTSFGGGQEPQANPRLAEIDQRVNYASALLASGRGTPAEREEIKFQRDRLLEERAQLTQTQDPRTLIGKINADLRAGLISPEDAQMELERAKPRGMSVEMSPDGTFRFTEGPGVSGGVPGTVGVGQTFNPADVNTALSLITDIHNSPELARITGPIAGGGGNDVEQLNVMQRAYYGSGGLATIEKIAQLEGQAWLAARDMLKGGGPITDYESRKAEQAVARLSRVKDEKEYQAALKDLHDAVREGMVKLQQNGKLPEGVQIPEPLSAAPLPPATSPTVAPTYDGIPTYNPETGQWE